MQDGHCRQSTGAGQSSGQGALGLADVGEYISSTPNARDEVGGEGPCDSPSHLEELVRSPEGGEGRK